MSRPPLLESVPFGFAADECWPWPGTLDVGGYGQSRIGGSRVQAHRAVYESLVGPIPDGLTLDHLCHGRDSECVGGRKCPHRRCVNPAHLEPVTNRENVLRGLSAPAANAAKTHCPAGHALEPSNVYLRRGGGRACRECQLELVRARRQRSR